MTKKRIPIKRSTTNSRGFFQYLPFILILFLGTGVLSMAGFTQGAPTTNQDKQPQFQSLEELNQHDQQFVMFYSRVFMQRNKTRVSFPFAFPERVEIMWLGFDVRDDDDRFEVLVSHPQLIDLPWVVVGESPVFLHQRNPEFSTAEEFLENLPDDFARRTVVDPDLKRRFPQTEGTRETTAEFDLDEVDFILTTFNHPVSREGVYYFSAVVDATRAEVGESDDINWYLTVPAAQDREVEYRLGNFDINYIQF